MIAVIVTQAILFGIILLLCVRVLCSYTLALPVLPSEYKDITTKRRRTMRVFEPPIFRSKDGSACVCQGCLPRHREYVCVKTHPTAGGVEADKTVMLALRAQGKQQHTTHIIGTVEYAGDEGVVYGPYAEASLQAALMSE